MVKCSHSSPDGLAAQRGLQWAKWGRKYNIIATKSTTWSFFSSLFYSFGLKAKHMPTRSHTSVSQPCLKHIVPTFKSAAVFTSDMPAVTSKHSNQSNLIKQYSTSSQFLVMYFLIHVDGFLIFFFFVCVQNVRKTSNMNCSLMRFMPPLCF